MAAGVVSANRGAAAAGELASWKPSEVKALVQMTSEFLSAAGLLTAGAGSINALAAVHWVADSFGTPFDA